MKKVFVLFGITLLSACGFFSTNTNGNLWTVKKGDYCANFKAVKVFQTLGDSALAMVCDTNDTRYCSGMVVFVDEKLSAPLWDEKVILPPTDKCFTYDGTYKYKNKGDDIKTVPVLGFGYKYTAKSVDEAIARISEMTADSYEDCKKYFKSIEKSLRNDGLKLCDCYKQAREQGIKKMQDNSDKDEEFLRKLLKDVVTSATDKCDEQYPKVSGYYK